MARCLIISANFAPSSASFLGTFPILGKANGVVRFGCSHSFLHGVSGIFKFAQKPAAAGAGTPAYPTPVHAPCSHPYYYPHVKGSSRGSQPLERSPRSPVLLYFAVISFISALISVWSGSSAARRFSMSWKELMQVVWFFLLRIFARLGKDISVSFRMR